MKFGKYLLEKMRPAWSDNYLDYKALKDLIKESALEDENAGVPQFSPRTTSLTVQRAADRRDSAEERFFQRLEVEVDKVGRFTEKLVGDLRERLRRLRAAASEAAASVAEASSTTAATLGTADADAAAPVTASAKQALLAEAKAIGDEFLSLEKYVNLNYMGFHKILKKHDKMLPASPCRQFYIAHLHNQPWVKGNYSDLLVVLSSVYSQLRGDTPGPEVTEEATQGFVRSTTKYWVRMSDVSTVKHHVLQHLPVHQVSKDDFTGDAQVINSVYLDNSSLELYHARLDKRPGAVALRIRWYGPNEPFEVFVERKTHRETWKGEESVKERFVLAAERVVPFLEGEFGVEEAQEERRAKGDSEEAVAAFGRLFSDVQRAVDAKQLKPMVRTQYMRTAFQVPFDASVRISLDTNLAMIKENPEEGPSCTLAGRWYRDPSLPVLRTEITRFPHAVLEVKLALAEGEAPPDWVTELLESGLLTEVHKFSKFIHGTVTLFPDMVQAVPYWVDDESVRASMLMSAPEAPPEVAPTARDQKAVSRSKPRKRYGGGGGGGGEGEDDLRHPLLGDHPTLALMGEQEQGRGRSLFGQRISRTRSRTLEAQGADGSGGGGAGFLEWWFAKPAPPPARKQLPVLLPAKTEPKTFFANERTFLSWLHMAVTIGSIASALLGFTGSTRKGEEPDEGGNPMGFIAMVLLPVAILMCGYALLVYLWRSGQITQRTVAYIDDRRGPLALAAVVVGALGLIFTVGFVELVEDLRGRHSHVPSPPAAGAGLGLGAALAS